MLSSGDHIISMDDLYGGTNRYFRKVVDRMGIKTSFVDATNPEDVENAIQENTKVCIFKFYLCFMNYPKIIFLFC
jgi:cystathionine gamma-lyase